MKKIIVGLLALSSISAFADVHVNIRKMNNAAKLVLFGADANALISELQTGNDQIEWLPNPDGTITSQRNIVFSGGSCWSQLNRLNMDETVFQARKRGEKIISQCELNLNRAELK